ncbi:MAG: phosphonoacetaldehyde reductase [Clostridiales bacterium]|nr:phosphonoacetaldehyde reductase [Clostridiales bacterium]
MEQLTVNDFSLLGNLIKGKKIFLIHGGSYNSLPVKAYFENLPRVEFTAFSPNPKYEQIAEGVKLFNDSRCDLIVAVGGGSAIDVAKCVKLFCKMDENENYLSQKPFDTGVSLIAVPTTAGSGSEATKNAVIYYQGAKQSVAHPSLLPNAVLLEPSVLKFLPLYQKKCTMFDALCQAIESFWSANSTPESKELCKKAILLIKENRREYIEENTLAAAEKIMLASNLAGKAINITATTAPHAMGYKITTMYNLPHGHAVALCMSAVWEYILGNIDRCSDIRGKEYLNQMLSELPVTLDEFNALLQELQIEKPKSNDREKDIDALVAAVNTAKLKTTPVEIDLPALRDFYSKIVD